MLSDSTYSDSTSSYSSDVSEGGVSVVDGLRGGGGSGATGELEDSQWVGDGEPEGLDHAGSPVRRSEALPGVCGSLCCCFCSWCCCCCSWGLLLLSCHTLVWQTPLASNEGMPHGGTVCRGEGGRGWHEGTTQCLVTYPLPHTPWLAGSPEIEVSWDGHKDLLLHPDPVPVEDQACRRHVDLRVCMRPMVAEESGAGERSKWLLL